MPCHCMPMKSIRRRLPVKEMGKYQRLAVKSGTLAFLAVEAVCAFTKASSIPCDLDSLTEPTEATHIKFRTLLLLAG